MNVMENLVGVFGLEDSVIEKIKRKVVGRSSAIVITLNKLFLLNNSLIQ